MTEMDYLAHERGVTTSDGLQPIGAFADILARCEVSRVLLLLLLQVEVDSSYWLLASKDVDWIFFSIVFVL